MSRRGAGPMLATGLAYVLSISACGSSESSSPAKAMDFADCTQDSDCDSNECLAGNCKRACQHGDSGSECPAGQSCFVADHCWPTCSGPNDPNCLKYTKYFTNCDTTGHCSI